SPARVISILTSSYRACCAGVWRRSVSGAGSSLIKYGLIFSYWAKNGSKSTTRSLITRKANSILGKASTSTMCAAFGSICRKSEASVLCASSAIALAISTPVGPAPTSTNVRGAWRCSGSGSISAASEASQHRDTRLMREQPGERRPPADIRHLPTNRMLVINMTNAASLHSLFGERAPLLLLACSLRWASLRLLAHRLQRLSLTPGLLILPHLTCPQSGGAARTSRLGQGQSPG